MVIAMEQREAYSEVLEVLRHMNKFYVDKIPKKIIMFLYDNCSLDYDFKMTKTIGEQEFKPQTLDLLALLNLNYWTSFSSKDDLITKYNLNDKMIQDKLNAQLEQENKFTKIDVTEGNLPAEIKSPMDAIKAALTMIKNFLIKFFRD